MSEIRSQATTARGELERSAIGWQQYISRALGCKPGQLTYQLEECIEKIEALKPRTVNSAAELDALPHESVIRDSLGDVYEKWSPPDESMTEWMTPGTSWTPAPTLPVTVLFAPGDAG